MRLIDADGLLSDRMKGMYYHLPNGDTAIPIIDIEHAPTVDAVEVVRCKDCKHWTQSMGKMKGYGLGRCDFHDADLVTCNGYCYWAERRTDE